MAPLEDKQADRAAETFQLAATPSAREPIPNVFSCDVEDWEQGYSHSDTVSERCYANTNRCLELLAEHGVKGTFFVQSMVAEQWPVVVRAIQSAGHDIQSHSHLHQKVHLLGPKAFREDLRKSIDILQEITGEPVRGFRAPCFSISEREFWAFDIMAELGLTFDSSLFPMRMRRYGLHWEPGYSTVRGELPGAPKLEELPVSVMRKGRVRIPVGGGGYLRLFPARFLTAAMRSINREGRPFVLYCHPYEFDPNEFDKITVPVPTLTRWSRRAFRNTVTRKLAALFQLGRFTTMPEALAYFRARTGQSALEVGSPVR